jgi:hypothetical protein
MIVASSTAFVNVEINRKRPRQEEVPNFIDLEGNEEHISKVRYIHEDFLSRRNLEIDLTGQCGRMTISQSCTQ